MCLRKNVKHVCKGEADGSCKSKGSISIEAAICSVFVAMFFAFVMSLLQYVYVYKTVQDAIIDVAGEFSCYSAILHESGLDSLSDTVKNRLLEKTGALDNDELLPLVKVADTAFEFIDTTAYNALVEELVAAKIEKKRLAGRLTFDIEITGLSGSEYFKDGIGFKIVAKCKTKSMLPLAIIGIEGYGINVCVCGNSWTSGSVSKYSVEDINVWSLDNFKRGKVLEQVFGSNLPFDFPTIDIYNKEEKSITAIRSIDHTKKTYLKKGAIEKELLLQIDKLSAFTEGHSGDIYVKAGDYTTKKIILVMPENRMTQEQSFELATASTKALSQGIDIKTEFYQVSDGN